MNVRSVVYLSKVKKAKKKNGNVQAVSTSTPGPKTKGLALPSQAEIMKNPMKYIAVAVKQFQGLTEQVEKQGEAIVQIAKHIQDSDEKLAPLVNAIEQANAARAQVQASGTTVPPQGQGGIGAIMQMLPALLSGGGGSNPMMEKMMQGMMERQLTGMDLSNALLRAMTIKLAPELADQLITKIVPKKE